VLSVIIAFRSTSAVVPRHIILLLRIKVSNKRERKNKKEKIKKSQLTNKLNKILLVRNVVSLF